MTAIEMRLRLRLANSPANAASNSPVQLHLHPGHLLFDPRRLHNGKGSAYRVYSAFARVAWRLGPERAIPMPGRISAVRALPHGVDPASLILAPDLRGGADVLDRFAQPAGESAAWERLELFLDTAQQYRSDRDRPDRDTTSGLSEYLAHGEISPRSLWAAAEARAITNPVLGPDLAKFQSELLWREFAWHLLVDFPQMDERCWQHGWEAFPWRGDNPDALSWQRAQTGVELVDAGLREMRVTGRMHNRVRMVVASYLTKHLLTDWRLGLRHFADSLTDWDPASNAMNWQWVAGCGPDAAPFFRIFNPERQAARFDPLGRYRQHWLAGWSNAGNGDTANGDTAKGESGAQAYFSTIAAGWEIAQLYRADRDPASLTLGRQRALAAYGQLRAGRQGSDSRLHTLQGNGPRP
jgi:deoxyribodipyrimidine photo-lyase